jgi:hypothetical protein
MVKLIEGALKQSGGFSLQAFHIIWRHAVEGRFLQLMEVLDLEFDRRSLIGPAIGKLSGRMIENLLAAQRCLPEIKSLYPEVATDFLVPDVLVSEALRRSAQLTRTGRCRWRWPAERLFPA